MSVPEPEILFARRGAAGLVSLNRPQALNAVTHAMVRALANQLKEWAEDAAVSRVVIRANGERAFSAGGDIRDLYELGRAGHRAEALNFWRDEYPLNALIKHFRKPYIALIDGIVMGGGVGISVNGSHRVAGDKFQFAMPEVGIGFFPDVGATYFLPRLPGELGTFCALSGERLGAADAVAAGVATHRVRSARFRDLIDALCGTTPVDAMLAAFAENSDQDLVMAHRPEIDRIFAGDRIEDILDRAERAGDWASGMAAKIRAKSPLSLKIALRQMRRGKGLPFDECMRTEFRIVSRIIHGHDFYEGVRAVVIDKDNAPRWDPPSLAQVGEAEVERHFAPLGAGELAL
jgi:enoyl-CoA hydratase/carnithine racemase